MVAAEIKTADIVGALVECCRFLFVWLAKEGSRSVGSAALFQFPLIPVIDTVGLSG